MRVTPKVLSLFLLRSSRPLLWPAVLLPYIGGVVLSHAAVDARVWQLLIFLTWPYNFVLYTVNDYFDRETDAINPRKKESGLFAGLKPGELLVRVGPFLVCVVLVASMPFLFTLTRMSALCLAALLVAATIYSAPPFRIKEKPPLDSLLNGFLYFGLPFLLGWAQQGNLQGVPWLKFGSLIISTAGFHMLAASIDYTADKLAHVRTAATVLGMRFALLIAAAFILIGLYAVKGYPAAELFLLLTVVCIGWVYVHPSEQLGKKLGYYCIYPGFIVASILCILQVLAKF